MTNIPFFKPMSLANLLSHSKSENAYIQRNLTEQMTVVVSWCGKIKMIGLSFVKVGFVEIVDSNK